MVVPFLAGVLLVWRFLNLSNGNAIMTARESQKKEAAKGRKQRETEKHGEKENKLEMELGMRFCGDS